MESRTQNNPGEEIKTNYPIDFSRVKVGDSVTLHGLTHRFEGLIYDSALSMPYIETSRKTKHGTERYLLKIDGDEIRILAYDERVVRGERGDSVTDRNLMIGLEFTNLLNQIPTTFIFSQEGGER
ncbi:hypothetical protein HYW74_03460 [Candidatus Pacearchaeota archaeon]|nr:hypothetical protein [Candidatus Pacearchaeota archaeon]